MLAVAAGVHIQHNGRLFFFYCPLHVRLVYGNLLCE